MKATRQCGWGKRDFHAAVRNEAGEPGRDQGTQMGGFIYGIHEIEREIEQAYRGHHQYDWVRPRRTWLAARCPVYIDFGDDCLVKLETYDESGLPCIRRVAKRKFVHDAMTETLAPNIATRFYPIRKCDGEA